MDTFPPLVESALSELTEHQRAIFKIEYDKRKKTAKSMLAANFFFVHFFVYGKVALGWLYIFICLTMIGLIWWLAELVMMPKRINEYNHGLAADLAMFAKELLSPEEIPTEVDLAEEVEAQLLI